jgi:hypothetical protein
MVRRVENQRLAAVGYVWAFASPGARAHYDRRRKAGDRHSSAQRNLYNRLLGCLHHCLATGTSYSETTAFPAPPTLELATQLGCSLPQNLDHLAALRSVQRQPPSCSAMSRVSSIQALR